MASKYVHAVIFMYCVAGTAMTLANKVAIKIFPFPMVLIVIQNVMAVGMMEAGARLAPAVIAQTPAFEWLIVKRWLPLVLLFVMMLVSSLCALMHVSAVTLVVLRNLSSLVVALGDCMFIGTAISIDVALCLVGMLVGAILYGIADVAFTPVGYVWLLINVLSTSAYQIYIKMLVQDANIKKLKALGMSYYNNVISLPCLGMMAIANREIPGLLAQNWSFFSTQSIGTIALSGVIGFLASTTAFALNTRISATSLMVLNNANKFMVIIFSELLLERTLGRISHIGAVVVLVFGFAYANIDRWVLRALAVVREDDKDGQPPHASRSRSTPWNLYAGRVLMCACLLWLSWLARLQKQSHVAVGRATNHGVRV